MRNEKEHKEIEDITFEQIKRANGAKKQNKNKTSEVFQELQKDSRTDIYKAYQNILDRKFKSLVATFFVYRQIEDPTESAEDQVESLKLILKEKCEDLLK